MAEKSQDTAGNEPEQDQNCTGQIDPFIQAAENLQSPQCCTCGEDIVPPAPPKKVSLLAKRMMKLGIILGMLLLLQIPLLLVSCQVESRSERQLEVQQEISNAWGNAQNLACDTDAENLKAEAVISSEMRNRGIYEVPVYIANVKIEAEYEAIHRDHVTLQVYGLQENADEADCKGDIYRTTRVDGIKGVRHCEVFVNGVKTAHKFTEYGIKIPVPENKPFKLKASISMCGSKNFSIYTFGISSKVRISGDWEDPGFTGSVLPFSRRVKDGRFTAEWNINKSNSNAGVNFCIPAGSYQQIERTMTYATFLLVIFFFTLFVGEILSRQEIHPLQYAVASGAPVLFYLLLLALSEHAGFSLSYLISAAAIVLMVTGYAVMFMGKVRSALIMGGVFALSYLLNFFILRMEDFALLAGTIVMMLILGVLMLITGKINRCEDQGEKEVEPEQ